MFDKHIVYSTNYNFEFAYLHSLFSPNPLRNRPYDVVIVDEVDNMFLDNLLLLLSLAIEFLFYIMKIF